MNTTVSKISQMILMLSSNGNVFSIAKELMSGLKDGRIDSVQYDTLNTVLKFACLKHNIDSGGLF